MAVTSCTVKESRVTREDGRSCPELQAARWHPQLLLQSALLSDPALENRGTRGRAESGPPVSQAPVPLHRLPLSLPAPGTVFHYVRNGARLVRDTGRWRWQGSLSRAAGGGLGGRGLSSP